MLYQSTRGDNTKIKASEAITRGLSKDGGLYVPESFPSVSLEKLSELVTKPYSERSAYIMGLFLDEFSETQLNGFTSAAYNETGFTSSDIAPLYEINKNTHFLELWHGPTSAFKDMALQVMPHLLVSSLQRTNAKNQNVCVLVATSGDTGKAALEGFCDISGIKIMVFYPKDGVSEVQKLQMTSQRGDNVGVTAVEGNFDDTQTGVKEIFSDKELAKKLDDKGFFLSSANSINWGRLVPQIAYYVSAYCDLVKSGKIKIGEKINFCVPTGNFGNILAAYYALKIGLPINKLICASNRNDVLTQFITTGAYDKNRAFYTTMSPSMDILVSSNLERLLYELSDKDGAVVSSYMSSLAGSGRYDVPAPVLRGLQNMFASGYCSEEDTKKTIADTWENDKYLIDTHTAVACKVMQDYRKNTGDDTLSVIVSTASPFKFCESVLDALGVKTDVSGAKLIDVLSEHTGVSAPARLLGLKTAKPRFSGFIKQDEMKSAALEFLGG
ncbi:MAG: threonine synthase [Oscillospiraceae bacterium]|nr:threonine synthase [Oscillospiraceae bacterium]